MLQHICGPFCSWLVWRFLLMWYKVPLNWPILCLRLYASTRPTDGAREAYVLGLSVHFGICVGVHTRQVCTYTIHTCVYTCLRHSLTGLLWTFSFCIFSQVHYYCVPFLSCILPMSVIETNWNWWYGTHVFVFCILFLCTLSMFYVM